MGVAGALAATYPGGGSGRQIAARCRHKMMEIRPRLPAGPAPPLAAGRRRPLLVPLLSAPLPPPLLLLLPLLSLPLLLASAVAYEYQTLANVTNVQLSSIDGPMTAEADCADSCTAMKSCSGYVYESGMCDLYDKDCRGPVQAGDPAPSNYMARNDCPGEEAFCLKKIVFNINPRRAGRRFYAPPP